MLGKENYSSYKKMIFKYELFPIKQNNKKFVLTEVFIYMSKFTKKKKL